MKINIGLEVTVPDSEFFKAKQKIEDELGLKLSNEVAAEHMSILLLEEMGIENEDDDEGFALHTSFLGSNED